MEQALIVLGRFEDDLGQAGVVHFPQIAPDKTKRRFPVQLVLGIRIIGPSAAATEMPAKTQIARRGRRIRQRTFSRVRSIRSAVFRARHDCDHALRLEADDGHPTVAEIFSPRAKVRSSTSSWSSSTSKRGRFFGHDTFHAQSGCPAPLRGYVSHAARGRNVSPPAILAYVSGPARLRRLTSPRPRTNPFMPEGVDIGAWVIHTIFRRWGRCGFPHFRYRFSCADGVQQGRRPSRLCQSRTECRGGKSVSADAADRRTSRAHHSLSRSRCTASSERHFNQAPVRRGRDRPCRATALSDRSGAVPGRVRQRERRAGECTSQPRHDARQIRALRQPAQAERDSAAGL